MSDYTELKRLAEALLASDDHADFPGWMAASDAFDNATGPAAVLALIAENERLNAENKQLIVLECHGGTAEAAINLLAERDQLKAENERLAEEYDKAWRHDLNDKKNVQALSGEVARLSAENEALASSRAKLAGELSRLRAKHKDWSVSAALGQGEQS